MNEHLPESLLKAQKAGVEYFAFDVHEWKLEFEGSVKRIEQLVGCPVFAFANNGFGDHLFLKMKPDGGAFEATVYEFFHEGPEINRIEEDLETVLELKERPPSTDAYPKAVYATGEPVQPGDRVQIKVWAEFWKGWQEGTVVYVPGISKKNSRYEFNGLKWAAIKFRNGELGPLVDPTTGILRKVRFVERGQPKRGRG
jgi:hypothetical protein